MINKTDNKHHDKLEITYPTYKYSKSQLVGYTKVTSSLKRTVRRLFYQTSFIKTLINLLIQHRTKASFFNNENVYLKSSNEFPNCITTHKEV